MKQSFAVSMDKYDDTYGWGGVNDIDNNTITITSTS